LQNVFFYLMNSKNFLLKKKNNIDTGLKHYLQNLLPQKIAP